jgi:hypothetical protein
MTRREDAGVFRGARCGGRDGPARFFDNWYREEHLPDAAKTFKAQTAWRAWSRTDPSLHYAFYQFADVAAAEAVSTSPAIRTLVAEFDARWGTRVTRTREILEVAD